MATQLAVGSSNIEVVTTGGCTPTSDKAPQKMKVPAKRVIPVIFLPGIMGSNLRLKEKRRVLLKKDNNIAWRPDRVMGALSLVNATPARRQLQLDPWMTEVDIYDPSQNPTGNPKESASQRHDIGTPYVHVKVCVESPLLVSDPPGTPNGKTMYRKAMERGWGEIYYSSYHTLLEQCESKLHPYQFDFLHEILNRDPAQWGAHPMPAQRPITVEECKAALKGCWFPVHAMGYNWLQSNRRSGIETAARIRSLIQGYCDRGYQCEKVMIITHSMGGLVARALIHPEMGQLADKVLGIVHGVMPAIGAPAAYKRMRCGFEEGFAGANPAPKVLGNLGAEVTAVLGNSQGGLELLPSCAYGNGWLEVRQNGVLLHSLPKENDPYDEIYLLRNKWYGLLREEWLNPAKSDGCGFDNTSELLRNARDFHRAIDKCYHNMSFAHYGADVARPSWCKVTWHLDPKCSGRDWITHNVLSDDQQGVFRIANADNQTVAINRSSALRQNGPLSFEVNLGKSAGAGDETVPMRSADDQLFSGGFKGVFRQRGYEHQGSYNNQDVVNCTVYCLIRIAAEMQWKSNG